MARERLIVAPVRRRGRRSAGPSPACGGSHQSVAADHPAGEEPKRVVEAPRPLRRRRSSDSFMQETSPW